MTQSTPTDLVTVSYAAKMNGIKEVLPQILHKYIRENELPTYEDPRTKKRMVSLAEVKAKVAGQGGRGRPQKELGSSVIEGVVPGTIVVRVKVQEVVRTVHTITNQSEDGIYAARASSDPKGFKDIWRSDKVKQLMEEDKMFVLDRWRFMAMLAESFETTGDNEIAATLRQIEATEREASEERFKEFQDAHRAKIIEAEEAAKLNKAAAKEMKSKEFEE